MESFDESKTGKNYFCPVVKNALDIEKTEPLLTWLELTKRVLICANAQCDLQFNKKKLSGTHPSDYISEKSLKSFVIEPQNQFIPPDASSLEHCELNKYIPSISNSRLFEGSQPQLVISRQNGVFLDTERSEKLSYLLPCYTQGEARFYSSC